MASNTGRMSVAVSPEKQARLDAIANTMSRSRNWVVNEAINQYLDLQEWQEREIETALKRADNPAAEFHSNEEVTKWLSSWGSERELPPPTCK